MKVHELLDQIKQITSINPDFLDDEVVVRLVNPSIGTHAATQVKSINAGFDWNKGRAVLETTDECISLPPAPAPGKRSYEDTLVVGVAAQDQRGTSLFLTHRGGFVGDHLRTKLEVGDRLRIIKMPAPAPRPIA